MLIRKRISRSRYRDLQPKRRGRIFRCALFFLVEMRRIELLSENPSTQLSSWTVCYLEFPSGSANRHAIPSGSPFLHDRLKCERPMHVHHSNDAQSEAVVLIGGTGDPQVTALPSLRRSAKIRQPQQQYCCRLFLKVQAVYEITRLATLIVFQNPRRNHCTPILACSIIIQHFCLFVNCSLSQKDARITKKWWKSSQT